MMFFTWGSAPDSATRSFILSAGTVFTSKAITKTSLSGHHVISNSRNVFAV